MPADGGLVGADRVAQQAHATAGRAGHVERHQSLQLLRVGGNGEGTICEEERGERC